MMRHVDLTMKTCWDWLLVAIVARQQVGVGAYLAVLLRSEIPRQLLLVLLGTTRTAENWCALSLPWESAGVVADALLDAGR